MNKQQKRNAKRAGLPGSKIPRNNRVCGTYRNGPSMRNEQSLRNLPKEIARMFY